MNMHQFALACLAGLLTGGAFAQSQTPGPQAKTAIRQGLEGRIYMPGPFERVELAGSANVRLLQGEQDEVFIVGDAQAQERVSVTLNQGRLDIRSEEGWKFWPSKRLDIQLTVRQLQEIVLSGASDVAAPAKFKAGPLSIKISGAGSVRFDELMAERLDFGISGSGVGVLRGRVELLDLKISGKGRLAAEDLHAHTANVKISGVGNAELWVGEQLNLTVSGVGHIDYWGQPTVNRKTSGIAKVVSRGDRRMPPEPPVMPAPPAAAAAPNVPAAAHRTSTQ